MKSETTVIINIWKRPYLEQQLEFLFRQSLLPDAIWILQNERFLSVDDLTSRYKNGFPNLHFFFSELNLAYFGRFSLANNVHTKYTWIIDDDVIPGASWLDRCVQLCEAHNSIVAPAGRLLPRGEYPPKFTHRSQYRDHLIGDFNEEPYTSCPNDVFVDYGSNSYFFKTEWLRHFWNIWPCTFSSGEDIHLSGTSMVLGNIRTLVPRQDSIESSGSIRKDYGFDEHASWRVDGFTKARKLVFDYLMDQHSWRPILWR